MNTIFECLYVFCLRKWLSIKLVCNCWGMGGHPKNVHLRIGGGDVTPYVYPRTYTITFYVFTSILSCFICRNLTLPLLKRDVFVTNGYFALTRSISFVMKYVFLT